MKKEKGVVIDDNQSRNTHQHEDDFPTPAIKFSTRNASSKYDFVKVKVWLGDNADHYYVLSRFLLSRMLTVTKLMERRGYGEEYINRYKMMTRFHHQRVPLVILVCGTACVGKSTIATQLAQRLNLPNVLQTDMVYELLRTATDAPLASSPVWARDFNSPEELITEFCRECRIVRKGLAGDLKKAMKDGKPIIIEGSHLDPSIYLMDDENKLPTDMPAKAEEPNSVTSDDKNVTQMESNSSILCDSHSENTNRSPQDARSMEETNADLLNKVSDCLESINIAESVSDDKGETIKGPETDTNPPVRKEKSGPEPIIVPIVLKMAEFDHKDRVLLEVLSQLKLNCFGLPCKGWREKEGGGGLMTSLILTASLDLVSCIPPAWLLAHSTSPRFYSIPDSPREEWISTRTFSDKCLIQDKDKLISNLKTIQDYLCSFKSQLSIYQQQHFHKHWIGYIVIFFSVLSKVYCLFLMEALSSQLGIRLYAILCLFGPMRKNKVAADGVKARNQTSEVLDKDRLEAAEIVSLAYLTGIIWDRRRNGEAPMKWFGKNTLALFKTVIFVSLYLLNFQFA
ncbi:hypothetical protein TEA_010590 [Camellia sinensis var. sinensis]|uniref:2-phosphoglycerate kinase n=1 Tax=Camellia sinensis var. sinensis TaxID=542762 RepID=A0A4S4E2Z1_CAMSN|nr:hypothetical protein TEA_010590 [Camellia sinensis var. sinensis]